MSDLTDLREECGIEGDWGGTPWGDAILDLLDRLEVATKRADTAEAAVREAHAYCARPAGICLPIEPLA